MKNSWGKEERRNYTRVERSFIVSYFDKNDPQTKHNISQIKNMSLGGICFVTSQLYAPGTKLGIELRTPFIVDAIEIQGTVLESKEKIPGILCETRLKFEELNPDTTSILKKIVETFLKISEGKQRYG